MWNEICICCGEEIKKESDGMPFVCIECKLDWIRISNDTLKIGKAVNGKEEESIQ